MILKFVYPAKDRIRIFDNVQDLVYVSKRQKRYGDKNFTHERDTKAAGGDQVVYYLFRESEDIERNDKDGKKYVTYWEISYLDIRTRECILILFDCSCFICNDQGKTIDRVG